MNLFFADDMGIFRDDWVHTEKDSGSREHETSFSYMDGACREFQPTLPTSSVQVLGEKGKMQHWIEIFPNPLCNLRAYSITNRRNVKKKQKPLNENGDISVLFMVLHQEHFSILCHLQVSLI